ncbi:MAG: tRNA (N6-isopentenyl adenosine(37)-C2)-methylthiotransferase MiaB [bacterium]
MYATIVTFGCQMNKSDSSVMAGILRRMGYTLVDGVERADLVILNTCSVREHAEDRVYGRLGELKSWKEGNPLRTIGVCGCMAQRVGEEIISRAPHVDFVLGVRDMYNLGEVLREVLESKGIALPTLKDVPKDYMGVEKERDSSVRAWVPIMYGCDNFCSYCIVPYLRGREVSRPSSEILEEVRELGETGYKEVTLLGQNVNSYGKGLPESIDFAGLLRKLDRAGYVRRIRYITSHPKDMSWDVIRAVRESDSICEHFHLPVQAGSDRVLRLMNRGYSSGDYRRLVESIRREVPGASITTDIIVGFPSETEEEFRETLRLVEEVRFDGAYMYKFSPRSGTPAAELPDQTPEDVKRDRLRRLISLQDSISAERARRMVGEEVEVLIEGVSHRHPGKVLGRTRTDKAVLVDGGEDLVGKIFRVTITDGNAWILKGKRL